MQPSLFAHALGYGLAQRTDLANDRGICFTTRPRVVPLTDLTKRTARLSFGVLRRIDALYPAVLLIATGSQSPDSAARRD